MQLRASIYTRLIASVAISLAVVVGALVFYFPSQQLATLRDVEIARLDTYGELLSGQVRSAVAFADRATASEVLSALSDDPDFIAVSLYGDGQLLYAAGAPSAWAAKARPGVRARKVYRTPGRLAVVSPVITPEGPRGALVIEISLQHLSRIQREVITSAALIGVIAVLLGTLVAAWIARSLVRRLRAMGAVAQRVVGGSTDFCEVAARPADELDLLGHAFNAMLTQLRAEQARLRDTVNELTDAEDELERTNRDLEHLVAHKTQGLRTANAQLQGEMARRGAVESELRQAQKLESVGRLASGIAHEINTPVQFVSDSCAFLETATRDVLAIIADHRVTLERLAARAITTCEAAERAQSIETERDLGYLSEQIPIAVSRAMFGLERVSSIVRAMKEFAYVAHPEQVAADINRALLTTLAVARNEYKYVADVRTDLGELPTVVCQLNELNQVFLNIVVNAAHAIEDRLRDADAKGVITVRTRCDGDHAMIEIHDDGCGIEADIVDKIFDPFFTTKEIGRGTGQGLAIAHSVVVDKHRGKLSVSTMPGLGTTFTIRLPIAGAGSVSSHTKSAA